MKVPTFTLCLLLTTAAVIGQPMSNEERELMNAAYSASQNMDDALLARLKAGTFASETRRKFTLIQAYGATDRPELVKEAIRMTREIVESEPDGCSRDWAKLILAPMLSLNGEARAAVTQAEECLANLDLTRFKESDDPFIQFLYGKFGIRAFGWESFIRDNLMMEIGSYYLNRARAEGGPDIQRAYDCFAKISAATNRKDRLSDARFKGMHPTNPVPNETGAPHPQQTTPGTEVPESRPASQDATHALPERRSRAAANQGNCDTGTAWNNWIAIGSIGAAILLVAGWLVRARLRARRR